MGFSAAVSAIGVGVSIFGATQQQKAQKQQAQSSRESIAAQQRAEAARQKALELDSMRRKREIIRAGIKSRSQAVSTATAQGAAGGSGLEGGLAEISGQTGVNILGVDQNASLGRDIFSANQDRFSAESRGVSAASRGATGAAISSLGGAILKNTSTIDRIGTSLFSGRNPTNVGSAISADYGSRQVAQR